MMGYWISVKKLRAPLLKSGAESVVEGYMKKSRTRSLVGRIRDVNSGYDTLPCESVESPRPLKLLSLTPSFMTLTTLVAPSSATLWRYCFRLSMDTQKFASMFSGLDAYLIVGQDHTDIVVPISWVRTTLTSSFLGIVGHSSMTT